jgi:hypothetical protein
MMQRTGMQSKAAITGSLLTTDTLRLRHCQASLPLVLAAGATEVANLKDDLNYVHPAIAAASIRKQVVREI